MRQFNRKVIYSVATAIILAAAAGLFMVFDQATVSAQKGDLSSRAESKSKVARADQLAVALNFGSASEYTVFGAKGVRGDGAGVSGKSGSGLDEASLGEDGSGLKARSGVTKALSMINQLPCQDMDSALTGGTFGPGVYCVPSAALTGQMTLDAGGDSTGSFVFRIAGSMKTTADFQMSLENGAKAGNVFFVADTASLAPWTSVIGSVIARGTVGVEDGASIKGRAFSKEGEVILGDASNVALADAFIQICKRALHDGIATTGNSGFDPFTSSSDLTDDQNSLRYKIFLFQINGGAIIEVPTGSCSNPILVVDGNNTIQELLNGFYTNRPDRTVASGNWFNRFRLVNVSETGFLPSNGAPAGTGISSTDFTTRRVNVNVAPSPSTNPLILTFTNTFAIPAVIEICKFSANGLTSETGGTPSVPVSDTVTEGFFDFRVNTNVGITYTIPVGVCTGPIQVLAATIPQPTLPGTPPPGTTADATVYVTELAEPGFTLERMTTVPTGRKQGEVFNRAFPNSQLCAFYHEFYNPLPGCADTPNVGGGYQWGKVYEASTPQDQTIFNFFNRTNPGIIKVCKIAGRGVPIGTRFVFEVRGREAGALGRPILPGTDVIRTVTVSAGPASQGGFCSIVTDDPDGEGPLTQGGPATRFIVGTLALVRETGVVDDVAGVQQGGFGDAEVGNVNDGPTTVPASEVRVSRISVNGVVGTNVTGSQTVQGFNLGTASSPNPDLFGTNVANRRGVIFRVGRGETVVTFVNRLFRPTRLKLCKVAASPSLVGTNFTFGITIDNENGLVPGQTNEPITVADVTIPAGNPGPSGQGNCVIVNGPYEPMDPNDIPVKGTFDVGSTITVTESPAPGTGIVSITSPTGTPVLDLPNRRATLTLGFPGGFNELVFTNNLGGGLESDISTRFTGDGLLLSNDVIFVRLFAAGLLLTNPAFNEFQRADAAPRATLGDAIITSGDVIQARRYAAGLDPPTPAGGPLGPIAPVTVSSIAALSNAGQRTIRAATSAVCGGFYTTVAIMLDSDGNEAGAGFTVTFDPARLSTPEVSLGSDAAASEFILTVNPNNIAAGELGILLDGPVPFAASPSQKHLVDIRFQVAPGANAGPTEINFNGKTIMLSTSDGLGTLLATNYQPTNVTIAGPSCATSTSVTVTGRVLSPEGNGLRNATVFITDTAGNRRSAITSSLGFYQFDEVRAGQPYVVGVSNKRYRFDPRLLQVDDNVANVDFMGRE
ncbi:hypothetical protein BH20ACI2_BH20ACI2_14390 [soil metagenome]